MSETKNSNELRKQAQKDKWTHFKEKGMEAIIKGGSAIGNNRFLVAIRDAFMLPFALVTGASVPLILANLFFSKTSVIGQIPGVGDSEGMYWVDYLIGQPLSACFGAVMAGFSIYIAVGLAFFIARSYGKDGIIAGALGIAIFFVMQPTGNVQGVQTIYDANHEVIEEATNVIVPTNYLSSNGLIVTLLAVVLGTYVYVKLSDVKWLVPKMPDSVPPMVAKSFGAIFTSAIVLVLFAFINQIWFITATEANLTVVNSTVSNVDGKIQITETVKTVSTVFIALESVLAGPLSAMGMNLGTTILCSFLIAFFWFFGIHGTNIMLPVTTILWDLQTLKNIEYWQKWLNKSREPIVKDTGSYWDSVINVQGADQAGLIPVPVAIMGYVGGTGATLGFLIAIFIFSKNKVHRELAKLSIGPGIFGINEPVNFGFPVVLNPIFFVPYTFAFTLVFTLGHVYVLQHWMRTSVAAVPALPFGFYVLFLTGFDWIAFALNWVNLLISFVIWLPFVWIVPKYEEKIAAKTAAQKALKLAAKKEKTIEQKEVGKIT